MIGSLISPSFNNSITNNSQQNILLPNKNVDPTELSIELPKHDYNIKNISKIYPFNTVSSNWGNFSSLSKAMSYVKSHCLNHYGKFTRNLAKTYIKKCSIYDPYSDIYISCDYLTKKQFENAFLQARASD